MVKKRTKTKKNQEKHKMHKKKYHDTNQNNNSNMDYIDDINADSFDQEDADVTSEDQYDSNQPQEDYEEESAKPSKQLLAQKIREKLKNKINNWLDYDDKIKDLNVKLKKYKDAKKQQEDVIINMLTKLGMEDNKIDVHDDNNNLRSRVYRYKSVTKGSIKEDIIKDALMEAIRDEKKVDQLVKKIESKRPINERYYLKRTKGNKDE